MPGVHFHFSSPVFRIPLFSCCVSTLAVVLTSSFRSLLQEINVLPKDLEISSTVGTGLDALGQHQLFDLVQVNNSPDVGCIVRIERDQLKVSCYSWLFLFLFVFFGILGRTLIVVHR